MCFPQCLSHFRVPSVYQCISGPSIWFYWCILSSVPILLLIFTVFCKILTSGKVSPLPVCYSIASAILRSSSVCVCVCVCARVCVCVWVCVYSMNVSWILKHVMLNKHKQFGRLSIYDRAVTFQNINQIINTDLHNCSCASLAMKYLFLVWHLAIFRRDGM